VSVQAVVVFTHELFRCSHRSFPWGEGGVPLPALPLRRQPAAGGTGRPVVPLR